MYDFPCKVEIEAKELLKRRGLKATPQRLAVLHVLHTNPGYMETREIHECVRELLPKTGLATIYRTLECLSDIGLTVRLHLRDGCQHYSVSDGGRAHFMVCTDCKSVVELDKCYIDKHLNSINLDTGFRVNSHFLQLYGQCSECLRTSNV